MFRVVAGGHSDADSILSWFENGSTKACPEEEGPLRIWDDEEDAKVAVCPTPHAASGSRWQPTQSATKREPGSPARGWGRTPKASPGTLTRPPSARRVHGGGSGRALRGDLFDDFAFRGPAPSGSRRAPSARGAPSRPKRARPRPRALRHILPRRGWQARLEGGERGAGRGDEEAAGAAAAAELGRLPFLDPPRDAEGRRPEDPEYDGRKLRVSEGELARLSPMARQLRQRVKRDYFDAVLFFKKGKFYELYGVDAVTGQRELGLKLTASGAMPMAGVPGPSFEKFAAQLVARGYRVARVDVELEARAGAEEGGIQRRRLQEVLSRGTALAPPFLPDDQPGPLPPPPPAPPPPAPPPRLGPAPAPPLTGRSDPAGAGGAGGGRRGRARRPRLQTLLARHRPVEVVLERARGPAALATRRLLAGSLAAPRIVALPPDAFATAAHETAAALAEAAALRGQHAGGPASAPRPPPVRPPRADGARAQLRAVQRVEWYGADGEAEHAVLDAPALANLEVIEGRDAAGPRAASLLAFLDRCATGPGRRELRRWLLHPLVRPEAIGERLDALEDLARLPAEARAALLRALRPSPTSSASSPASAPPCPARPAPPVTGAGAYPPGRGGRLRGASFAGGAAAAAHADGPPPAGSPGGDPAGGLPGLAQVVESLCAAYDVAAAASGGPAPLLSALAPRSGLTRGRGAGAAGGPGLRRCVRRGRRRRCWRGGWRAGGGGVAALRAEVRVREVGGGACWRSPAGPSTGAPSPGFLNEGGPRACALPTPRPALADPARRRQLAERFSTGSWR
eukprot:tig00000863_g4958.t1